MDTSKLPAWPTKDDPLSAFLNRHSWLIVLIFAPLFVVTYFPANYAIPFPIWDKWWWAIRYVGYVSIALQILRHRNLVPWLTSFLLLFLYFGLSSRLTDQTPDWGTGNFHVIMDLGFVSLTAYVFSLKKEPALLAYIIPGIIMSCVNFYTFFVFKDVPGGMAAGITAYDQTQSWFFFTHDNGSFFITFPTVVLVLYYGLQVRKSLRYVAIGYAGVVAAIYTWMFSVAAMFGYGLLFIAAVVALVLQRDPKRRFSSNLYPICIAVGLVICLLMVLANTNDILPGLVAFLGKSYTIQMRQTIWRRVFEFFPKYPLTGIGLLGTNANVANITFSHCHNILLQQLYTGGLLDLAAALLNVLSFWKRGRKVSPAVALLYVSMFVYLLVGTFDFYDYFPFMWAVLFMAYAATAESPKAGEELPGADPEAVADPSAVSAAQAYGAPVSGARPVVKATEPAPAAGSHFSADGTASRPNVKHFR